MFTTYAAVPHKLRREWLVAAFAGLVLLGAHSSDVPLARAVVNLPVSAVATVWAKVHDGRCTAYDDLTVACGQMHGGYANGGTTAGNVWMYGTNGGDDVHRHETRHSDQWAMFDGGPVFPLAYVTEYLRVDGDPRRNVFEEWAGLHDGGYE
jgi:hypothetical protein